MPLGPWRCATTTAYSVVLGVFHNAGYQQDRHPCAGVLDRRARRASPSGLYVASERALSIAGEFARFGTDIAQLRKRLRGEADVALFSQRSRPTARGFRRRLGIDNEQAMDLFHQTVSMKSVGNLTEFVRGHMLEPFDVAARIAVPDRATSTISNRAHEAVLRAKRQIELLAPLVARLRPPTPELDAEIGELRACREALRFLVRGAQARPARQAPREARRGLEETRCADAAHDGSGWTASARKRTELRRAIAEEGGDRLEQLAAEIRRLEREREARERKARRYADLARRVGREPG